MLDSKLCFFGFWVKSGFMVSRELFWIQNFGSLDFGSKVVLWLVWNYFGFKIVVL